jgi:hypothetical protein
MKSNQIIIGLAVVAGVFVAMMIILNETGRQKSVVQPRLPVPSQPSNPRPPEPSPEPPVEPEWTNELPVRQADSSLGKVLSDIDSHMPAGHIYRDRDKITWGHETSHGITSRLRMKYGPKEATTGDPLGVWIRSTTGRPVFKSMGRINVFYVLDNRAVIIQEPNCHMRDAARLVPQALRGDVYQLYMVQQAGAWGDAPLYIFDEWVAYSNGAAVRQDLKIQERGETVQYMLEFCVYSIALAKAANIEEEQFKDFLKWHLKRAMDLWEANRQSGGDLRKSDSYWNAFKTSELCTFVSQYLGEEWVKETLIGGE